MYGRKKCDKIEKMKKFFKCQTYHIEIAFVFILLSLIAIISKKGVVEWLGVFAVLLTFGHLSVADRLREQEERREKNKEPVSVSCYKKLDHYYFSKEALWFVYFSLLGAWSAVAGIVIFLIYKPWRKLWRKYHSLES